MRKNSIISSRFYSSLKCRIFIMGAASEGESVLFEVYDNDDVIYSCITDSFVFNGINVPIDVAEQHEIKNVKDVFWTHPHDDHSIGLLEIIKKFRPENVYIPPDLINLPESITTASKAILEEINQIKGYDARKKYSCNVTELSANTLVLNECLHVNDKSIPFYIMTIAPISGKTRKNVINEDYSHLNDYSIAVSVVLGDFCFMLTGDLQDRMVRYMKYELQCDLITPNILKIPHHGSKESWTLLSLFDDEFKIDASICTAKKSSGLPRQESIDVYSSNSNRLYMIDDRTDDYAICGIEVDILAASIKEMDMRAFKRLPDCEEV